MQNIVIQYLFSNDEHELTHINPHGNAKAKAPYQRIMPSTIDRLKLSIRAKDRTPKEALDDIYSCLGDVTEAANINQLPRGPQDLYNARHHAQKRASTSHSGTTAQVSSKQTTADAMFILLERAKREEEVSSESTFIRECKVHPDLFVVLALERQLEELVQFCTSPGEFSIFSVDPTFNVFKSNISLTVTTYRNLKLQSKNSSKSPVFLGPVLLHQKKDWKTYSNFFHSLVTEKQELEGVLACGTDGEKALIDGLKKNFRFAIFLRCFLHFKENIKRELVNRGFRGSDQKSFMEEIFGRQEGEVKYTGLVDCMNEEDFDCKLESLQCTWSEREGGASGETFFDWFKRQKVNTSEEMLSSLFR